MPVTITKHTKKVSGYKVIEFRGCLKTSIFSLVVKFSPKTLTDNRLT